MKKMAASAVITLFLTLAAGLAAGELKVGRPVYNTIPISAALLILYAASCLCLDKTTHRKIWNMLLLITFLVSGILGILLALQKDYGWTVILPFNELHWHVEAGIAMTVVGAFHALWHWPYFANIIKLKTT